MQPPHPELWPPSEGRDWRGQKLMGETTRVLTINELLRLTRKELCDLAAHITAALANYPEGSAEHTATLITLRNIRWVLARRAPAPG
jgi:hypothetical protein